MNKLKKPQRITWFKQFIAKYNWERIHYTTEKGDWKKFEKEILKITLNASHTKKEKKISCLCFKT